MVMTGGKPSVPSRSGPPPVAAVSSAEIPESFPVAEGVLQRLLVAHVVLAGEPRVVGHERDPLPGRAQRLDRVACAGRELVADVDGAVQVDDELVVRGDEGGEGHEAGRYPTPPCDGSRS